MIPVLYRAGETAFTTCGLGELPDALSCTVTEVLGTDSELYLEMEYPVDGLHYSEIAIGRLIKAPAEPGEPCNIFCITSLNYATEGVVKIYAPQEMQLRAASTIRYVHAGQYDWTKGDGASGDDVSDVFANLVGMARPQFYGACTFSGEFSLEDGADVTVRWEDEFPTFLKTIYAVADAFGGEIEWGFNSVHIGQRRGEDTGLEIRYGVNMLRLDAETDAGDSATAVLAVAGDSWAIRYASGADGFPWYRIAVVDVSDYVSRGYTVEQAGDLYLSNEGKLKTSIRVEFDPEGTPNVQADPERVRRLHLGDTVTVVHPGLELMQKSRIVKTVFNVLLERYESLDVGEIQKNITDTIADLIKKG